MLERTDVITNEVLEPITFVLVYPTALYGIPSAACISRLVSRIDDHSQNTSRSVPARFTNTDTSRKFRNPMRSETRMF
jgi:hypothetical protein